MDGFVRQVLDEAERLGLPKWQRLLLTLAVAILAVVLRLAGRELWQAIRRIEWKVEPSPEPISDGGQASDRDLPPAQPGEVPPAGPGGVG